MSSREISPERPHSIRKATEAITTSLDCLLSSQGKAKKARERSMTGVSVRDKWCLCLVAVSLLALSTVLLLSATFRSTATGCILLPRYYSGAGRQDLMAATLLHYATTSVTPQQSRSEISLSLDVLLARRPCNFLVFGLGHDSLMWAAFNPSGTTLFLEEDPKWVSSVLRDAPQGSLVARAVKYPTQLHQADVLFATYKRVPECLPSLAFVKGNRRCPLALADMPEEVYGREWDVIMIDAPRGYFPEAPGRMGAIWSAAVMARNRKAEGHTDVFLHDVDRKVEKEYALEFLCKKYLVKGIQRLWHFRIPKAPANATTDPTARFC